MITIKEYIKEVLANIREAEDEEKSFHKIRGVVDFDIATVVSESGGANAKVNVLGVGGEFGGKLDNKTVSRVKFSVQTRGAIAPSER